MKTQQQVIEQVTNKLNQLPYCNNINYEIKVERYATNKNNYWVYIQTDQPWINLVRLNEIAEQLDDTTLSVACNENGINLLATITV